MDEREKLIREKIQEEEEMELMKLDGVKQIVWDILINNKQYHPYEIEIDPVFILKLSNCDITVSINFIINLPQTSFMVIRCVNSGLESWERYVTAFARCIKDYQIPYAVVTDGKQARIIDVLNNSIVGESVAELFSRHDALKKLKYFRKIPCPPKRLEMEKRIIYAFEGIKCPTVK